MTARETLSWAVKKLKTKKIDSPRLDAEILLSFALAKPKEWLYARPEYKLAPAKEKKFKNLIARRAKYEPVAYITGKKEFYGLEFKINRAVLIPRPLTETLVESALGALMPILSDRTKLAGKQKLTIIDVGTGSGCIAITIARELKKIGLIQKTKIWAIDKSAVALRLARANAKRNGLDKRITFIKGSLLKPLSEIYRSVNFGHLVVLANLPYLTDEEWKNAQPEIKKYEPKGALVGGRDGLKFYKELLKQLRTNWTDRTDWTLTCFFEIGHSPAGGQKKSRLTGLIHKFLPDCDLDRRQTGIAILHCKKS